MNTTAKTGPTVAATSPTASSCMAPTKQCDLILEGGVTSAVIYAGLIKRLGSHYQLRSLGGTSAGAIAAAAGAIAEMVRRRTGKDEAFTALDRLVQTLAQTERGQTGLLRAFQPAPPLRAAFALFCATIAPTSAAQGAGWLRQTSRGLRLLATQFPWLMLGTFCAAVAFREGVLPGGLLIDGWSWAGSVAQWLDLAVTTVLSLGLAVVAVGLALLLPLLRHLPANHYGLCSGHGDAQALTPMLNELFNRMAGRAVDAAPVTFGDLWSLGHDLEGQPLIDLQVITTALHLRRPFKLPGDDRATGNPLAGFYFSQHEWRKLFPASVVDWLVAHQHLPPLQGDDCELLALPMPRDWPIVMAVRLSLSFPLLLSAVPMYALWQGHGVVTQGNGEPVKFVPAKVYFSDGGITSNCPIDLFDVALPAWPTFAVNLHDAAGAEFERAFSRRRASPDTRPHPVVDGAGALKALFSFAAQVVMTGIQWRDSLARTVPGYRERVLNIGLPAGYGGLNLAMTGKQIQRLADAGVQAADQLGGYDEPGNNHHHSRWEQHRWLRLRTALAATRQLAGALAPAESDSSSSPPWQTLVHQQPSPEPAFASAAARRQAGAILEAMQDLNQNAPPDAEGVTADAPTPTTTFGPRLPT